MVLKRKLNNLLIILAITASTGDDKQPSIIFYTGPNQTGRSLTTSAEIDDMADAEFTAYSVCVERGTFILYDGKDFNPGGDGSSQLIYGENKCQNVDPKPTVSARPAGDNRDYTKSAFTLYTYSGFQGNDVVLTGSTPELAIKGNSIIITGKDPWKAYAQPNYGGPSICIQNSVSVNVPITIENLGDLQVGNGLPTKVLQEVRSIQLGCDD